MLALWIHELLILAVLAGIARRARWRATLAFPLYLVVGAAHNVTQILGVSDPEDWLPWLLVDLAQRILALCVAVEIGARIFHRGLPGGRIYTGRAVLVVLLLGLLAALVWGRALSLSLSDRDLYFALVEGSRRVAVTSAATFTVLGLAVVSYFDWPLDPYHRDVGAGFLLFQLTFVLLMPWPDAEPLWLKVWPLWLYGAVLLLWSRAAWRRVDTLGLAPDQQALVLPWTRGAR